MELTIKDIQSIAHGAVRTEKNEAGEIALYRFTEKQMALYARDNPDFYVKSFGTAGVRLEMDTDTDVIDLSYHTRTYNSDCFTVVAAYIFECRFCDTLSFGVIDTVR